MTVVGEAFVEIRPQTQTFTGELAAKLGGAQKAVETSVNQAITPAFGGLKTAAADAEKGIAGAAGAASKGAGEVEKLAESGAKASGGVGLLGGAINLAKTHLQEFGGSGNLVAKGLGEMEKAGVSGASSLSKVGGEAKGAAALLPGVAVGGALVGGALAKMAADGISHFVELTAQIRGFQRVTGASAQDASKLVFAMHELGISPEAASTAFGKLSRNVVENGSKLDDLGIKVAKNRDGSTNLAETMLNVSDAFRNTTDQAQRNTIAIEAFGRGGLALVPILARGREGIKELFSEAQAHGLVFDQKALDQGKQFSLDMKNLKAAFEGVEITLGKGFIPLLDQLATGATGALDGVNKITSAVGGLSGIMKGAFALVTSNPLDFFTHKSSDASKAQQELADSVNVAALSEANAADTAQVLSLHEIELRDSADALKAGTDGVKAAMDAFSTSLNEATGAAVSADSAETKFYATIADGLGTLKAGKASLDLHSKAGRDDHDAIDSMVSAALASTDALAKQGATMEAIRANFTHHIADLHRTWEQAGFTKDQIAALDQQYHLTPADVTTVVTAAGAIDAARVVANLRVQFGLLGSEAQRVFEIMRDNQVSAQEAINAQTGFIPRGQHHALGGFVTHQSLSWLAEGDRPELVLPLTDRERTLDLLRQAGLAGPVAAFSSQSSGSSAPIAAPLVGQVALTVGPFHGTTNADEVVAAVTAAVDDRLVSVLSGIASRARAGTGSRR